MRRPSFLIVSEPRTGSNNLSYCLDAHPDLAVGNELLHPNNGVRPEQYGLDNAIAHADGYPCYHWIDRVGQDMRMRVLADLFERHNGFKIHSQHVPVELLASIAHDFDCFIILTRRASLFDQAVSNYVATARNRWHADENPARTVDVQSFEITAAHFEEWLEAMLAVRYALWRQLRKQADRVIIVEYDSFYAGTQATRVQRVNELYRKLGLRTLDDCETQTQAAALARLQHYLDSSRQKLTGADLAQSLVGNYAEITQVYAHWAKRSQDRLALT